MVRASRDAKPIKIGRVSVDGESTSWFIQGGFLANEDAWVPNNDSVITIGPHTFLKLEKASFKLGALLGVKLVRNHAFSRLQDMRDDVCYAEIQKVRAEQNMLKDRVTKRTMAAWRLPLFTTIILPVISGDSEPLEVVMQLATDLRATMWILLEPKQLDNIVRWMSAQDADVCSKGTRHAISLGNGVSYSDKRQQIWCHVDDDDGMKRKKVRKLRITKSELDDPQKVADIKAQLWSGTSNDDEYAPNLNEDNDGELNNVQPLDAN